MAQEKTKAADLTRPSESKPGRIPDAAPRNDEDTPAFLTQRSSPRSSDFWGDLRDSLPPWLDEIIAIALIIFGILSLLALLNTSTALVAMAWSDILTTLFGYGSLLVAAGILLLGLVLLLPKAGIQFRFSSLRLVGLEAAFLCVLAIMHLLLVEEELRFLARAGGGGGMIGYGIAAAPYWLLGRIPALLLFGFIFLMSMAVVLGLQRRHIVASVRKGSERLLNWANQSAPPSTNTLSTNPLMEQVAPELTLAQRRTPLMRIRPDEKNIPPSLRPSNNAGSDEEDDLKDHPLFKGQRELKIDFNVIGQVTNKRTEDGHLIVIRPDGREKRFFRIQEMQENKKVGRRDKVLPALDLLSDAPMQMPDEDEINRNVVLIENTLLEFEIDIDVVEVQVGPTVTRYAVQPYHRRRDGSTERTRLNKIASYTSDLALALSAKRLRMEIPVPGTNFMGIEVPNKTASLVTLRSVYESKEYFDMLQKREAPLLVPLGRDVSGRSVGLDIARMPHLLIAGTTGSGKSVCIAAMAAALILNNTPDRVKLVMLDPKMVELSRFNGIPHLLGPVETDTERIIGVLKWCTREMDRRYKLLEEHAVRNIDNYNAKFGMRRRGRDYMPHIVILIDEIGDLMLSRPEETETAVTRLAQMARAVGMHLVIATQRPSVDVITGLIKANFPGRIAFSVASGVDSRVILDSVGAENLLGNGDMLFMAPDAAAPRRVQGCYVSDDEVREIVRHWTTWNDDQISTGKSERMLAGPWERGLTRREFLAETDPMLEEVIELVVETQEASASLIQRRIGLGYPRAARLVDMLYELGVVGEQVGGGRARKVLIAKGEDPFKRIIEKQMEDKLRKKQADFEMADADYEEGDSFRADD